jgi:hypothetical protein
LVDEGCRRGRPIRRLVVRAGVENVESDVMTDDDKRIQDAVKAADADPDQLDIYDVLSDIEKAGLLHVTMTREAATAAKAALLVAQAMLEDRCERRLLEKRVPEAKLDDERAGWMKWLLSRIVLAEREAARQAAAKKPEKPLSSAEVVRRRLGR